MPEANVLWAQWKIRDQMFSDLCQAGKSGPTSDYFLKKKKKKAAFPGFTFCEINIEEGLDRMFFFSWF